MALPRLNHGVDSDQSWRWLDTGMALAVRRPCAIPSSRQSHPGRVSGTDKRPDRRTDRGGRRGQGTQGSSILRQASPPRPSAASTRRDMAPWGPKRYSPNATVRRSGTRPRSRRPTKPPQSLPHYVHLNTNHQLLTNLTIVRSINGYGSPCAVVQRSRRRRSAMPRRSSSESLSAHE